MTGLKCTCHEFIGGHRYVHKGLTPRHQDIKSLDTSRYEVTWSQVSIRNKRVKVHVGSTYFGTDNAGVNLACAFTCTCM